MGWIHRLYETYENCRAVVGDESDENKAPLLPICHTTQRAHIEIVIDSDGDFKRAIVIPKKEARTIIPCTESSGGRTRGPAAHPLCDKLQYIAQDYTEHGGAKQGRFNLYEQELERWCNSEFSHAKAMAVLKFVKKGHVARDLIDSKTLMADNNGTFLKRAEHKSEKDTLTVFDVVDPKDQQEEAFVRWIVDIPNERESRVWRDSSLWDAWIKYYSSTKNQQGLCYVLGQTGLVAGQHPAKLRNDADKGKLISANDSSGFTYRGRFLKPDQAAGVDFVVTQKAHSALRWLISRQGYRRTEQAVVAWATSGKEIPQPFSDSLEILGLTELPSDEARTAYTAQNIAIQLKRRIAGYGPAIDRTDGIVVMGLDSATPGRAAITFYRELTGSKYIERINAWHETCAWLHRYRFVDIRASDKSKRVSLPFFGAPAPKDIAEAAYGEKVDAKLKKTTVERLLPCIIDGQPIPRDLVESTVRRASNRVAYKKEEHWQWEKALSIACALFRKFTITVEDYSMALDPERRTRDYLYGRLLALADSLEQWALTKANEDRQTTAARLMNRFAEHPYSTWRTIELALSPYKARLGDKSRKRQGIMDEVKALFDPADFTNDKRLTGEFLLGYSCQREYLRPEKSAGTEEDSEQGADIDQ